MSLNERLRDKYVESEWRATIDCVRVRKRKDSTEVFVFLKTMHTLHLVKNGRLASIMKWFFNKVCNEFRLTNPSITNRSFRWQALFPCGTSAVGPCIVCRYTLLRDLFINHAEVHTSLELVMNHAQVHTIRGFVDKATTSIGRVRYLTQSAYRGSRFH